MGRANVIQAWEGKGGVAVHLYDLYTYLGKESIAPLGLRNDNDHTVSLFNPARYPVPCYITNMRVGVAGFHLNDLDVRHGMRNGATNQIPRYI